jgi:hypothetical protein
VNIITTAAITLIATTVTITDIGMRATTTITATTVTITDIGTVATITIIASTVVTTIGTGETYRLVADQQTRYLQRARAAASAAALALVRSGPILDSLHERRASAARQRAGACDSLLHGTETPYFNPHGPTPGALQGNDYPLEY